MTWLNAWAVGFAAIAPVIVLLYLLKLKRRPMPVSTLLFWQRLMQESRRRALFQRLRNLLSLLLHLLIFALILGALMRPTLDQQVREGASTVVILDTRARMQALEPDGQMRLAKAKAAAAGVVRQASSLRQMAVINANAAPSVIAPFTDDEKALRERVEQVTPTDAAGDLNAAIQLAEELLNSRRGERRIVIFTDRTPKPDDTKPAIPRDVIAVGTTLDNVAITRFATRALLNSPQTSDVLLEVANFGRTAVKVNVELAFDGKLLDVKPLTIEPGARSVQVFPTVPRPTRNSKGWLTARLDTKDALAGDNVAYAVLPNDPPRRVLLVSKGNWFLEKLLAADQGLSFELVTPDSYSATLASKFDAVLMDNFLPPDFDLTKTTGNFFFIKATPFNTEAAPLEQPLISDTTASHPALRLVNSQNITLLRAAALALPKIEGWSWQAPIRSFDNPLFITGEKLGSSQRVAALALDITDSDLPLRIAFPLLMANTLHWLAGEAVAPVLGRQAGEILPLAEGETITSIAQNPWSPATKPDPNAVARDLFHPLTSGFYQLNTRDGARWLAVNTFSDQESDLRISDAASAPAVTLPSLPLARLTGWPLWQYLAAAALLLSALEWWLFHRRRTE